MVKLYSGSVLSYVRCSKGGEGYYYNQYGLTVNREGSGKWVLRNRLGIKVDEDKYRSDLAERQDIKLTGHYQ